MATKKTASKKTTTKKAAPKKKVTSKRAVRYSEAEKEQIIEFVHEHNRQNKRGGLSAAVKKFKVSPISITNWMDGAKKRVKRTANAARSSAAASLAPGASSDPAKALKRMIAIQDQIAKLEAEYEALKKKL